MYLSVIRNVSNERKLNYFSFDRKVKTPLSKSGVIGNMCALKMLDKNMLITTYHFGGLNDSCELVDNKKFSANKVKDIPILDISVFTTNEDITYTPIINSNIPNVNENVNILGIIYEEGKMKKYKYKTKILKIEQQHVINNIFPSIPVIVIKNNIKGDLFGFSGSAITIKNRIIGIISSVSEVGINCIPIYCIEKMFHLETLSYPCLSINMQLCELEDGKKTFYGYNIEEKYEYENLKINDCIIEIAGNKFDSKGWIDYFTLEMYIITHYEIGEKIPLKIVRNDEIIDINVLALNFINNCSVLPIILEKQYNLFGLIIAEFDISYKNENVGGTLKEMLKNRFGKNHFIVTRLDKINNYEKYKEIGFPIYELDNLLYYPILRYINGMEVKKFEDLNCENKSIIELIFEITPYSLRKIIYDEGKIISID